VATSPFSIQVEGLAEIQKAFKILDPLLGRELNTELRKAAEPVATTGEQLALQNIRNMHKSEAWAVERTGSLVGIIYVAPKKRGTKVRAKKRPNLAPLLMERAMEPALAANETGVSAKGEIAIDKAVKAAGF
jgi:hypothetical protein